MSKTKSPTADTAASVPAVVAPQATSTTTELTVAQKRSQVLANSRFESLRPDSEVASIIATNYMPGESIGLKDLTRVKVPPGGGTNWIVEELTGEEMYKELTGVVVHYSASGVLWAHDGRAIEGSKPLMITQDLAHGELLAGPDTDWGDIVPEALEEYRLFDSSGEPMVSPSGNPLYDWVNLPYNQWGTGRNGKGKRCRETRRVCLLREGDMYPLFLRVPPTSIGQFAGFIKKLKTHYYGCVVSLALEGAQSDGGDRYSKIVPKLATLDGKPWYLQPEEKALIKSTYVDRLGSAMLEADLESEAASDTDSGEDSPF